MTNKTALAANYYNDFKCIGSECEDSCCIGWQVDIDKKTFHFYKQNQHKLLTPLFKEAVKRNTNTNTTARFGLISTKAGGRCSFLDTDNLCQIQKTLGPDALSSVCSTFPRTANRFGSQMEYSLGLACPEVARLALLNETPTSFTNVKADPALSAPGILLRQVPEKTDGDPEKIAVLNDLRALSFGILQHRALTIDARLMLLGMLLEDAQNALGGDFDDIVENLSPTLANFADMLSHPEIIQNEFNKIRVNQTLKLQIFGAAMKTPAENNNNQRFRQCMAEATEGLYPNTGKALSDQEIVDHYNTSYHTFYQPFFYANTHILENYLVYQAFSSLFPCKNSDFLHQFRALISNYLIARIFLTGMAAHHKKMDTQIAVRFFQSFTRLTSHNRTYMPAIIKTLEANNLSSFQDFLLLIKGE